MILSNISIKRPVFATILNVLIVVFGLISLPRLAVEQQPNVDFPFVSIWIPWPGSNPVSVEKQVLEPVERAVNSVSGIESVRSTAFSSAGLVVLKFDLEKDTDLAVQEVRDKVFSTLGRLPKEVETPIIQKAETGQAPIVNVVLTGADLGIAKLSKIAEDEIRPVLQRVKGVSSVELIGIRPREIHVELDPVLLADFKVIPGDVIRSIKSQNIDMPAGVLRGESQEFGLRVENKVTSVADLEDLPLLTNTSQYVRIKDVARVRDTISKETTASFLDKSPTILFSVFKQSGGNTIQIANDVSSSIKKMNIEAANGEVLTIVDDNSHFIKSAIDAVKVDLVVGAILAILVVMLFLRDRRATIISALALPTAVIGTFGFLYYMGFTLNMMTMLGLSLSIGILIDDAIVVIENIYSHLSQGKEPKKASKDATSEIGLAVTATTLTVCAVFVPVAFMEGIIGRFFYQFGLTVAFAVLISLFVAFTLTPMLSSKWLKKENESKDSDFIGRQLVRLENAYLKLLAFCLHHRWKTLLFGLLTFIFSLFLLAVIPVAFFAREDQSRFLVSVTLPENINIHEAKRNVLGAVDIVKAYPGVENVVSSIGASGSGKPNEARMYVNLVKPEGRNYLQEEIVERVRDDLNGYFKDLGGELVVGDAHGGGKGGNIQVILMSESGHDLVQFSDQLVDFMKAEFKDAKDVTSSKAKKAFEYSVKMNLDLVRDVGLDAGSLAGGTRRLFDGEKVGELEDGLGRFDIVVKAAGVHQQSIENVKNLTFPNAKSDRFSLGSLSRIEEQGATAIIERFNGQKQITVSANYAGSDLSVAVERVQSYIKSNAPSSIGMTFEGEADIMGKSIKSMIEALLLAVLLIYLILCAQYERYLAPLVIMMALPLSLTGAFGALLLTGETISVYTMIGVILLMGLVTKNGILLVDFSLNELALGKSVEDAVTKAGLMRLRPILMTTFAAGFGMLPVAIGHGEGGEAKASMGIAVMGGLFASTLLTLIVVPCFFVVVETVQSRLKKRLKGV